MNSNQLYGCCSIHVLYDFGSANASIYMQKHSKEEVDKFIADNIKYVSSSIAFFIVALDQYQYEKFLDVFLSHGFEVFDTQYSKNHGNYTTLLIRKNNNKPEDEEKVENKVEEPSSIYRYDLPF